MKHMYMQLSKSIGILYKNHKPLLISMPHFYSLLYIIKKLSVVKHRRNCHDQCIIVQKMQLDSLAK